MSDKYYSLLIGNNFYEQRTPNSKINVFNLKKEKIKTIEKAPEIIDEIMSKFKEMEEYPSFFFDYQTTKTGIKILGINSRAGTHIKIPSHIDGFPVTEIGKKVLKENNIAEQVILPDTILSMDEFCFENCNNLRSVTLPKSLQIIPKSGFAYCGKLFDIDLSNIVHIEFNAFNGSMIPSVNLQNIELIDQRAFENCYELENVLFSNKIISIASQTFKYCVNLRKIHIPESVEILGTKAFECCHNLEEINFTNNLKMICHFCFECCKNLKKFIAPENLEEIQQMAFIDSGLEVVKLNKNLKIIGEGAFRRCEELKSIELYDTTDVELTKTFDFDKVDKIKFVSENKKEIEKQR